MLTVETDVRCGRGTPAIGVIGVTGVLGRADWVVPGPRSGGPRAGQSGVDLAAAVTVHRLRGVMHGLLPVLVLARRADTQR